MPAQLSLEPPRRLGDVGEGIRRPYRIGETRVVLELNVYPDYRVSDLIPCAVVAINRDDPKRIASQRHAGELDLLQHARVQYRKRGIIAPDAGPEPAGEF